jgi:hypothetical protein
MQAHGYNTIALHPKSILGIVYFSGNGGVKVFYLVYTKEKKEDRMVLGRVIV